MNKDKNHEKPKTTAGWKNRNLRGKKDVGAERAKETEQYKHDIHSSLLLK